MLGKQTGVSSMKKERVVMCMKWGALYPSSYVNVLYSAVKKNLSGPFRFVCLTNEPDGLDKGIESYPIPDLGLPPERYNHGAWPKIAVFKKDLYGLTGHCLFIDLDTIICGSLEPFFEMEGDFCAIGLGTTWVFTNKKPWLYRKWKALRQTTKKRAQKNLPSVLLPSTMGTGIFTFHLGQQPQIYDAFINDRTKALATFDIEQQLVEHYLPDWSPWPGEWIVSFKLHLRRPVFIDLFLPPKKPAQGVSVIAFHGDPRPIDLVIPGHSSLRELPHFWRAPVSWIRDYWVENGYKP